MEILISNTGGKPIYEQIADQIKGQILGGSLQTGTALPSMRTLAKELRISVITTKRAYDELERDGFVYTVAGKGSYVAAKNTGIIREGQLKEIEEHMREIIRLAPACELSREDLIEQFRVIIEEEYNT